MKNYLFFLSKHATIITLLTYIFGMVFSMILFLILNLDFGEITFSNDIGSSIDIFIHNTKVQLIIIIGALFLGIPTTILLFINGFAIGMTLAQAYISGDLSKLLLHLLPHGIFEIPGFLLVAILSYQLLNIFLNGNILRNFIKFLKQKKYLFLLSLILTMIAAIIEGL